MKNPQDSTIRNVKAVNKRLAKLEEKVKTLKAEMKELKRRRK